MSIESASTEGRGTQPAVKFGTFLGVYTPSVLTILGLIMYLRFGWVVGNVGLGLTLLIVVVASGITFITAMGASAISTNMKVGVGGEYYMISRSLGLELGGAIGIPLYLCRTLSITFYCLGLSESLVALWPAAWGVLPGSAVQLLAAGIIVVIAAVSGNSAEIALKLQIPIMIAVGISVVALLIGVFTGELQPPEMAPSYRTAPEGFWYVFAVFFPAVTGFTAGIGMSGDLEDPQKSIPKGTLFAVLTGFIVYMSIPVLLAVSGRVTPAELATPGIIWTSIAVGGVFLVYPGVWGAILSSAFGSVLGGPRVLQSLAADGLAPQFLARLSSTGQPTIATWVSAAIALVAVALGGLNAVAQFVTILFLTLYVLINTAAAVEKLTADPSYRPTINVPWFVSALGALGAIAVMFMISVPACIGAVIVEIALYTYLRRRAMQKQWGDVWAGFWVSVARAALVRLRESRGDVRNWRPHFLVFVGDTAKRMSLVRLASWFNGERGVITAVKLIEGNLLHEIVPTKAIQEEMEADIDRERLVAFSEVDVVEDYADGMVSVMQANGIAGLHSNTVLFGWPHKEGRLEMLLRVMRAAKRCEKSTVIARFKWSLEPGQTQRIDVWWRGMKNNGDLMLLLAHLMSLNANWRGAKICLRSVVENEDQKAGMVESLEQLLPRTRIEAETEVIVRPPDKTVVEVMQRASRDASLVFLGLALVEPGHEAEYALRLSEMAEGFGTTIFVYSGGQFAGRLI